MSVLESGPAPLAALHPEQFEGCHVWPPQLLIQAQR
jgi:hypothetical protein